MIAKPPTEAAAERAANQPQVLQGSPAVALDPAVARRRNRLRKARDVLARYAVGVGGIGVIGAIVLIFIYLLGVVLPLFLPAGVAPLASFPAPGAGNTLLLATEEQREIGLRVSDRGRAHFFSLADGSPLDEIELALPAGSRITAFAEIDSVRGWFALGLSDGSALVLRHHYRVSFPDDQRQIEPRINYPLGAEPIALLDGQPLRALAVGDGEESITFIAHGEPGGSAGAPRLISFAKASSLLSDEIELEPLGDVPLVDASVTAAAAVGETPSRMLVDGEQRRAWLLYGDGRLLLYDIGDKAQPLLLASAQTIAEGRQLAGAEFLLGGVSLLVADSSGQIGQWFPLRGAATPPGDEAGEPGAAGGSGIRLVRARSFDAPGGAGNVAIAPEQRRKGFAAVDADGVISLYHSTAGERLLSESFAVDGEFGRARRLVYAPRGNALLAEDGSGRLSFWEVDNEHPEVSLSALWGQVWYESYQEPEYIWQSSAANQDFEPKFSLMPLTFGTIKAAFYAMLFAMPLAICGAIYTAYFMSPSMRRVVKPTIEIMEALPTVILGFLAGLWLAPFVEDNLTGVFAVLLILPLGMLAFGFACSLLPAGLRQRLHEGWFAALLIPVVVALGALALAIGPALEGALFGGDMRFWLSDTLGLDFDQRNSLVVGMAMGFAVIPTIFSITEDAVFSVPRHLTQGSLALGATPWQTLTRVVILTASPGMFSAVMIGLGRAVGETMIVLMATGNTPIMDFNIFEGMRTLSANIAVEMPESAVGSSHYRILFLAALVLFILTFAFNTLAELVRQRLRNKYANL